MFGIIGEGANVALFISGSALFPEVGAMPKGPQINSKIQQQIVDKTLARMANQFTKQETADLNNFFAQNTYKVKLRNETNKVIEVITVKNAQFVNPPSTLSRQALLRYREVSRRATVGAKGDGVGAQKIRMELIDQALKNN
jgi:hypothetical protein